MTKNNTIPSRARKRTRKIAPAVSAAIPGAEVLDALLPPPSLLDGENLSDYEACHAACLSAVKPKDAIEQIWLRDFIDYSWDSLRLRRMKAALIQATRKKAVKRLVWECLGDHIGASEKAQDLAQGWSRSEEDAVSKVDAILEAHDLDLDTILAESISLKLQDLERIDKLIASYDYRRDAAIRELEKRRDFLAKRAREFADTVITDATVEEVMAAE